MTMSFFEHAVPIRFMSPPSASKYANVTSHLNALIKNLDEGWFAIMLWFCFVLKDFMLSRGLKVS